MSTHHYDSALGPIPLIGLVLLMAAGGGVLITQASAGMTLGAALLAAVILVSFHNAELGLHIILLSMLFSPEIVVGGVGGISIGKPEVKGDILVLRIEDLILSAVTLGWFARTAIFKELGLIRKTPLNGPIFAYIVSLVVATLFGVFFGDVRPLRAFFYTLKYIEYFVVYFIAVNHVRTDRQIHRLLGTVLLTCAICVVVGMTQIPSGERVAAPFEGKYGEPNTFGGYLVLLLALILGQALTQQEALRRFAWLAYAGCVIVPLLFTLSRTSWLATAPMLLTLIVLSRRPMLVIGPLLVLLMIAPLTLPQSVIDRYNYTLNAKVDRGDVKVAGSRLDTSTSARIESWSVGFVAWTKRPFLGYGVTGFGFIDAQYVRVLVEGGLVGVAAFLWLLWRLSRAGWDALQKNRGTQFEGLALGYIAGLVSMVTHGIGANTFIIVRIMEPFWFLTGIVGVLILLPTGQVLAQPPRNNLRSPGPAPHLVARVSTSATTPPGARLPD